MTKRAGKSTSWNIDAQATLVCQDREVGIVCVDALELLGAQPGEHKSQLIL